jgi:hypothetical protein
MKSRVKSQPVKSGRAQKNKGKGIEKQTMPVPPPRLTADQAEEHSVAKSKEQEEQIMIPLNELKPATASVLRITTPKASSHKPCPNPRPAWRQIGPRRCSSRSSNIGLSN